MKKRTWLVAFCAVMLLMLALPAKASAVTPEEDAYYRNQVKSIYRRVRYNTGGGSLQGYCGTMSGWQLYLLGIDRYPNIHNGNGEYDAYENKKVTTGGYAVKAYSAENYTLEEALNTITQGGTRDVYNVLVGFQRTNTAAGYYYGHACVIHAIIDGQVYFVEGFHTSLAGAEGNPIVCSIAKFAKYYNEWCTFEGIIEFGKKEYVNYCDSFPAGLFVETNTKAKLYSIPSKEDVNGYKSQVLRTAQQNERLQVTRLIGNTKGEFFYQVDNDGDYAYVAVAEVNVLRVNADRVTMTDITAPTSLKMNKSMAITGKVVTQDGILSGVRVEVLDESGNVILSTQVQKESNQLSLPKNGINFAGLPAGNYTYKVYADVKSNFVLGEDVLQETATNCVYTRAFTVGGVEPAAAWEETSSRLLKNGWIYENGAWCYYEQNTLQTGWFCSGGVDYYLQEDGYAVTGWQTINGKNRYFSNTGAMRVGWLRTDGNTYYMLSNGVAARGLRMIDDKLYFFEEDGTMKTGGEVVVDAVSYQIGSDGEAKQIVLTVDE